MTNVPLEPDHGYPLRLFVPRLCFWKSANSEWKYWRSTKKALRSGEPACIFLRS
jgi:hypothetical protein